LDLLADFESQPNSIRTLGISDNLPYPQFLCLPSTTNSPVQDLPPLLSSPWVPTMESSSFACIPTTINSTSSEPLFNVDTSTSNSTGPLGNQEKPLTPLTSTTKQLWSQLIMKSLSLGSLSNMKDSLSLPIPLSITPEIPHITSSPLALLAKAAAMRQPLPPKKQKTFHSTSPTPTSLPPQKKLKTTTNLNSTPTLDSSPQTTFSTSLKRKHEECIKNMVQLSNKWTLLNNRFKDTSVARMFRKKDSNTTLYLYHFHRQLYDMVTKEILLAIAKERNLQKRTILPFGTLSPYYQLLKDQTFLKGLQTLLRGHKRIMRSKSPSPIFIPSPGPSGGTGGPTIVIPEPPPSAPVTAPPPHVGPIPVIRQFIHPSSSLPKEVIPLPPIAPKVPSPPLVDPSPFVSIPSYPNPPPIEPP